VTTEYTDPIYKSSANKWTCFNWQLYSLQWTAPRGVETTCLYPQLYPSKGAVIIYRWVLAGKLRGWLIYQYI